MTTTVNLRKILDRKQWEMVSPAPATDTAGGVIASSRLYRQMQYYVPSAATAFEYLPEEDAWSELPNPTLTGTFGVGSSGIATPYSVGYATSPLQHGDPVTVVATAGTAAAGTTIVTTNAFAVNGLINYQVRCVNGSASNVGTGPRAIASNTATTITILGTFAGAVAAGDVFSIEPITQIVAATGNATTIATITTVNGVAMATAVNLVASAWIGYQLRCVSAAVTTQTTNIGVARWITSNTATAITTTIPFPAAIASGDIFVIEPVVTVTAGAASTTTSLTVAGMMVNVYAGYQIRCLTAVGSASYTNIGQVRLIQSNTAIAIVPQTAFSVAPATGDTFVIEPVIYNQEITYNGLATTGSSITSSVAVTATTITVSGTPFLTNALVGVQVKSVSGTVAANIGLVKTVISNTANVLTFAAASWTAGGTTAEVFELGIVPVNINATTFSTTTAGGTTTITSTASLWTVNALIGWQVKPVTGTAGNIGLVRQVVSNTANVLTIGGTALTATTSGDTFELIPPNTPWLAGQWATSLLSTSTPTTSSGPFTYQARITGGTGAGQLRNIVNNTQNMLVLANNWSTVPDATSTFVVEPTISYGITTSVGTNQTLVRDLRGFKMRVQTATNVFEEKTIAASTQGMNSVVTFTTGLGTVPNPQTLSTATTGILSVASATSSTVFVVTGAAWATNQLVGYQVKFISSAFSTSGNVGFVRTILSNTANQITLSVALPFQPVASDTFELDYVQNAAISTITGSATGTSTTIVTSNTWTASIYVGSQIRCLTGTAANIGQVRWITANTTTTLTLNIPLPAATTSTDTFELTSLAGQSFTTTTGSSTILFTVASSAWVANQFVGYQLRIISGTNNIGLVRPIIANTTGSNATVTTTAFPATLTIGDVFVIEPTSSILSTSALQLQSTRFWIHNAASAAVGAFKYYDYAYNTWYSPTGFSTVGTAVSLGTDSAMVATPSIVDATNQIFASGTATGGTFNTLINANKSWAPNQWANAYQVRILTGTCAGQVRAIVGNTATALTVLPWGTWSNSTNGTVGFYPDTTSAYIIEGNDDNIFLVGNNAAITYKFSTTTFGWTTIVPQVARAGSAVAGCTAHWAWNTDEPIWMNEQNMVSGRRIYSFRGTTAILDYYDIAANIWVNGVTYSPATTAWVSGTRNTIVKGRYIYMALWVSATAGARLYRYDTVMGNLDPVGQYLMPQGAALVGNKMFDASYTDGNTTITWIYELLNTSTVMLRMMLI